MKKLSLILGLVMQLSYALAQTSSQTIRGKIIDQVSHAGIPGAAVVIEGTDPLKATTTDTSGNFEIQDVPLGRYNIRVSLLGYKDYIVHEKLITAGKEVVLNIEMTEEAYNVEEIVVQADRSRQETNNSMAIVSARTFSAEDTRRYAGGMDDPARMVSAFAGVAVGNIQDNAIIIRGNSPKGVLWQLEGIEIPNPNHFAGANVAGGGFTTFFSNQLLASSDFFSGAFPAEYGNALAGVFDIRLRKGNNQQREYTLQAGMLGIDFAAEGPFVKGKKASYLFNYRYSTFGLIKDIIPSQQVPEYQDLSFKLNFPLKNRATLSVWGIGGLDYLKEPASDNPEEWIYNFDRIEHEFGINAGAAGVSYKKILNETSYINTSFAVSGNRLYLKMKRMSNNLELKDTMDVNDLQKKYTLKSFLNTKFSKRHTNRTGFIISLTDYKLNVQGAFGDSQMREIANAKGQGSLLSAFTQSEYHLSPRLRASIGFYAQYFLLNENYTIEPRAGLNYQISNQQKVSLGYGNHSQIEPLKVYFYRTEENGAEALPNKDLRFSRAHHIVLAYDYFFTKNLRLKIEPFYQYLYNIPVTSDGTWSMLNYEQEHLFTKKLVNEGTGTNMGVDFTIERFLNKGYYWLSTISVFDSKYSAGNGKEYNTRFNKNYVINLLGGKEFMWQSKSGYTKVLGLNAGISLTGGHRIVPADKEMSQAERQVVYDWSNPYTAQNPMDFSVDFTLTYRTNKRKHSGIWALQIKNLAGSPSNYMYQYNLKENELEYTSETVIVPTLSYKIEF
jgi:hypothetical protein